jgi:hypothetical protein
MFQLYGRTTEVLNAALAQWNHMLCNSWCNESIMNLEVTYGQRLEHS